MPFANISTSDSSSLNFLDFFRILTGNVITEDSPTWLCGWLGIPQVTMGTKVTIVTNVTMGTKVAYGFQTQEFPFSETRVGLYTKRLLLLFD